MARGKKELVVVNIANRGNHHSNNRRNNTKPVSPKTTTKQQIVDNSLIHLPRRLNNICSHRERISRWCSFCQEQNSINIAAGFPPTDLSVSSAPRFATPQQERELNAREEAFETRDKERRRRVLASTEENQQWHSGRNLITEFISDTDDHVGSDDSESEPLIPNSGLNEGNRLIEQRLKHLE